MCRYREKEGVLLANAAQTLGIPVVESEGVNNFLGRVRSFKGPDETSKTEVLGVLAGVLWSLGQQELREMGL
ncbi:MAG: hypothetical protein UX78_C0005G0014 [Candidatus Amesbacteria bacterium GW2011_GWA2_47_11]|nr:MAG: hypothetical protein UX78_C0005G0014 [Candidatus Amesbacteria bacterium GW2011_GWA2_47_11]KKU94922.1 MAG: hypothetical protein UY22_C0004G0017 [Candidatus Amesbacteria bacterium GW2011_GWC1_48_10]KKW00131.1 MAG: hypothetical protein UY33_C0015G0018 [Candidatus Amesbacteria bacterium GW2011_GWA1_48_9]